jgi:hypothetical protein
MSRTENLVVEAVKNDLVAELTDKLLWCPTLATRETVKRVE